MAMRLPFGKAAFLLLLLFILAFAFLSAHSSSCPPSTNDTPSAVKPVAPASCTALPLRFEPGRPVYALAGYFRSGNSWTRHLLQRATGILTGSVYNDAALQRTGLWGEGVTEGTLVVKTHLLNTTLFHFTDLVLMRNGEEPRPPPLFLPAKGAIHLVRNPFDSIASWHQFLVTGSHFETTDEFDIDQWESHVLDEVDWWVRTTDYWLKATERDPNFKYMLVRYEDLVKDTEGILRRMLQLIEAPMDEALIRCAVRSTDCTAMPWNCRSGKSGSLLHHYSNVQREYMIEKLGPLMLFLNYSVKDIPLDSDKDYVLGYRTPGTGYPFECRRSSAFIQAAIQTRKTLDNTLKEADATPLDIPPEVLYDPPLIVFHPDWANWMGWATSSSSHYHKWGKVTLDKKPSKCRWTWNYQEEAHLAHVVLMNGVPHVGKAGAKWCSKEFDVPAQKPFWQRWARMDYETFFQFPILAVPEWSALFDWRISWEKDSDLHITMHCPFPTERTALDPPPPKEPGRLVAYIASRCEAHERDEYVRQLMEHIDVTSYGRCLNNAQLPDEKSGDWPRNWDIKLRVVGSFKFALAFENYNLTDWVTEKMPQIIMAGAVPIYMGAPNIDEYVPGPKSIIKVSDFKSPKELAAYLKYLDENDDEYRKYFEWKRYPLSQGWQDDYNDCAYWQEHKLCDMALAEQAAMRERWQHKIPPPVRTTEEAQAEGDGGAAGTEKEASEEGAGHAQKPKQDGGDRENDQPNQDEGQCMDEKKCAPERKNAEAGKDADEEEKEGEAKADAKALAHPDPVEPLIPADNLEKKSEPTTRPPPPPPPPTPSPSPSPLPLRRDADEEEGLYREETGGEKRKRITQHIAQNSEAHTTPPPPQTKKLSKPEAARAAEEEERRKGLADPKGFPVRRDPDMEIAKELQAPGHEPAIRASAAKEVAAAAERRKQEAADAKAREEQARP